MKVLLLLLALLEKEYHLILAKPEGVPYVKISQLPHTMQASVIFDAGTPGKKVVSLLGKRKGSQDEPHLVTFKPNLHTSIRIVVDRIQNEEEFQEETVGTYDALPEVLTTDDTYPSSHVSLSQTNKRESNLSVSVHWPDSDSYRMYFDCNGIDDGGDTVWSMAKSQFDEEACQYTPDEGMWKCETGYHRVVCQASFLPKWIGNNDYTSSRYHTPEEEQAFHDYEPVYGPNMDQEWDDIHPYKDKHNEETERFDPAETYHTSLMSLKILPYSWYQPVHQMTDGTAGYQSNNGYSSASSESYDNHAYTDSDVHEERTYTLSDSYALQRHRRQVATGTEEDPVEEVLKIMCKDNCLEFITPNKALVVYADIPFPSPNPIHYTWGITDLVGNKHRLGNFTVTSQGSAEPPSHEIYINTMHPILVKGSFTITVQATSSPCGCVYTDSRKFIMATRPLGGILVVTPTSGRSIDPYKISVEDVNDDYAKMFHDSITFTFTFRNNLLSSKGGFKKVGSVSGTGGGTGGGSGGGTGGGTGDGEEQQQQGIGTGINHPDAVVIYHGSSNTLDLPLLPAGDAQVEYKATIRVTMQNKFNGVSFLSKNITIHPVDLDIEQIENQMPKLNTATKLLLIYSTVSHSGDSMTADVASALIRILEDIEATSLTETSLKIKSLNGLRNRIPPNFHDIGLYFDQLEQLATNTEALSGKDGETEKSIRKQFSAQLIVSSMEVTKKLLETSGDADQHNVDVVIGRTLNVVKKTSRAILNQHQPYEEPLELDTDLLKIKLQSLPPASLTTEDVVPIVMSANSGFKLPALGKKAGAAAGNVAIQTFESKQQLFPSGSSTVDFSSVNPNVLGITMIAEGKEVTDLDNSTLEFKQPVFINFTVSGSETSILFNNVPAEIDPYIVFETFSTNVSANSVALIVLSRELIEHPVYVVAKVDSPPDDSNFITEPGSDYGDVQESYHRRRLWKYKFCMDVQKVVLPKHSKEDIIEGYGQHGTLAIYPFQQWSDQDGLFENYTYVTKSRLDFSSNKTAYAHLEEENAIAHGIIMPWGEDKRDNEYYRSLAYINKDKNESKTLYLGLFSHIDLLQDCKHLMSGEEYEEKIFKRRYNMSMPITPLSFNCLFWNETTETWDGEGCVPTEETTIDNVACACDHLSIFTTEIFVPPNKIHFSEDVLLFKSFFTNPISTVIVTVFWLLYVLVMLWARREDKKDEQKAQLTVLMDNPPDGEYVYIVTVITGWVQGAGSTSVPTLCLGGSRGDSILYALYDPWNPEFETGSEKAFILTSTHSLGKVKKLYVSTSLSGNRPTWFLRQITVYDVENDVETHFMCNDWLSPEDPLSLKKTLTPAQDFKFLYRYNLTVRRNIREQHLWLSIYTRPPYSTFNRKQRVTCGFTYLSISMLVSLMYFGGPPDDPTNQYAVYNIHFSQKEVMISIQCAVITIPLNTIIVLLFKNSRPRPKKTPQEKDKSVKFKPDAEVTTFDDDDKDKTAQKQQDARKASTSSYKRPSTTTEPLKGGYPGSERRPSSPERRKSLVEKGRDSLVQGIDFLNKNMSNRNVDDGDDTPDVDDTIDISACTVNVEDCDDLNDFNEEDLKLTTDDDVKLLDEGTGTQRWSFLNVNMSHHFHFHLPFHLFPGAVSLKEDGSKKLQEKKKDEEKKPREAGLPWWFVYFAWVLAISVSLVSGYFTMLYGLSYGYDTSLKWALTFFGSFGQSAGVVQPMRVLLVTLLLCLCMKSPIRPNLQYAAIDIDAYLKKPKILEYPADLDLLPEHIYAGPDKKRIQKVTRHIEYINLLNFVFGEMLFYLAFFVILILVSFGERHPLSYHMNRSVRNCFVDDSYVSNMNFKKVKNVADIWEFLLDNFIIQTQHPARYRQDLESVIVDMSNVLVGVPRVRQARRQRECFLEVVSHNIPKVIQHKRHRCQGEETGHFNNSWAIPSGTTRPPDDTAEPVMNSSNTQRDTGDSWSFQDPPPQYKDRGPARDDARDNYRVEQTNELVNVIRRFLNETDPAFADERFNAWRYRSPQELRTPTYFGKFRSFSGGGYVQDFSTRGNVTLKLFQRLKDQKWLDDRTLAVFVEFSVWNPAINTISVVMLVFEMTQVGDIIKHHDYIMTLKPIHVSSPSEIVLGILRFTHAIFVFLFAKNIFNETQKKKTFWGVVYMIAAKHKMEMLILTSGLISWCFCVGKMWTESYTKAIFLNSRKVGFMNWYTALYFSECYMANQGLCLFFTICNFLQLPWFYRFMHILIKALNVLWQLSLAGVVCMAGLTISGYIRFAPESVSFRDPQRSLLTICALMVRQLEFDKMSEHHDFRWQLMIYVSLIMSYIWVLIFPVVQIIIMSVMSMYRRRTITIELYLADYFFARVGEVFGYRIKDETRFYREELFRGEEQL